MQSCYIFFLTSEIWSCNNQLFVGGEYAAFSNFSLYIKQSAACARTRYQNFDHVSPCVLHRYYITSKLTWASFTGDKAIALGKATTWLKMKCMNQSPIERRSLPVIKQLWSYWPKAYSHALCNAARQPFGASGLLCHVRFWIRAWLEVNRFLHQRSFTPVEADISL